MDVERSSVDRRILSTDGSLVSTNKDTVSLARSTDGNTSKAAPSAWQELLSETALGLDGIEEGPLIELEDEFEISHGKNEGPLSLSKYGWKEFLSDPGVSLGSEETSGKSSRRRHSSDDVPEIKRKDWNQFLSTSHLVNEEGNSKLTHVSPKTDEVQTEHVRSALTDDMATRQAATADQTGKSLPGVISGTLDDQTLPVESHFTVGTSSSPHREASGNLPVRPLTIGDSLTAGNPNAYRPISPFNVDLYPPRTASSTPVIPTVPSMSQNSGNIEDAVADDREGDMPSRERLQPLGRDGLEVKQGPPWGVTLPLFQPHSRKSSFSSSESGSSNGSEAHFGHQPTFVQQPKADVESLLPEVSVALYEGRLSRRSSSRSLESKEPMAAQVMNSNGTLKTQIGRFNELNPSNADVESPVSRILGPTFKATQKMLEELKRRPLGAYKDEMEYQNAQQDEESHSPNDERGAEGNDVSATLAYIPAPQNRLGVEELMKNSQVNSDDYIARFSELASQKGKREFVALDSSKRTCSADLTPKTGQNFPVENNSEVNIGISASSRSEKLPSLGEIGPEQSPYRKPEIHVTTGLIDNAMGKSLTISGLADLTPTNEPYFPDKNDSEVSRITPASSRSGEILKTIANVPAHSTCSKAETHLTSELTDYTLGNKMSISGSGDITSKNEPYFHVKSNSDLNRIFPTSSRSGELNSPVENGREYIPYSKMKTQMINVIADSGLTNGLAISSTENLPPKSKPNLPVKNISDKNHSVPVSFKSADSERLVENGPECSPYNKTETNETNGLTDRTFGKRVAVLGNVDSVKSMEVINDATESGNKQLERENIVDGNPESLSWENVLEIHDVSGDMSEFDRVASQSISLSNAVANRFREELKSVDLLDFESDDEGILVNDITWASPLPDSGTSESTTNDDMFRPKGLQPLTEQSEPVGIYDVRKSSGPGSTNRKRAALGQQPRAITRPIVVSGVYVSEGMTGSSGTEAEDKGVESMPEGHSTPKFDDLAMIVTSKEDVLMDIESISTGIPTFKVKSVPDKIGSFKQVQPSATVEHTWSVSAPVMSQLDRKSSLSAGLKAKQKPKNHPKSGQESVHSSEQGRKRIPRHKEQGKKPPKVVKQQENSSFFENISSDSSHRSGSGAGLVKKSVADIILDNFRREEQEQRKRRKKFEELKQSKTTSDLNELWERFQEFIGKNSKYSQNRKLRQHSQNRKSKQLSLSRSSQQTTPSELSLASSSDIPFTESKERDQAVDLSTDSSEEFEKFLRRVREYQSSDSGSIASRTSSDDHRARQCQARSTPSGRINRKPNYQISRSEQVTTTSEKDSESEVPLSFPMWLDTKTKHSKKKVRGTVPSESAICTCGRSTKKTAPKPVAVREVGVNCPTPPPVSIETNIVNIGVRMNGPLEESQSNGSPPSLVKLSLQDAFIYSKQDFIRRSRERIRNMKEKRQETSSGVVVVVPTGKRNQTKDRINERLKEDETRTVSAKPLRLHEELQQRKPRHMTQKEIRDVNKRIYKNLPEVKKKNEEKRRAEFYKTNRLRAKLYGKHVRNTLNRIYTAP